MSNSMDHKKSGRRNAFLCYTFAFLVVSAVVFCWHYLNGKTLIWKSDGWSQHLKALAYYGQYLRKIVRALLYEHRLVLPDWDFAIGEGADIIGTLHYYVVGDPLALFSVFVPTRFMPLFYSFLVVLRLYLAGLAFLALCFGVGQKNTYGICAGAISYAFCYWAICNAQRHPFFLNPMIYFPLVLLGVEKIFKGKRFTLLSVMVAISAGSNFYFFYMIVLLVVLYVAIRAIQLYGRNRKRMIRAIGTIALGSVIGVMIAGILLLPIINQFLSDSRMGVENSSRLLYPISYYSSFPSLFLSASGSYWVCIGLSAPVMLAIFLLFHRSNQKRNSLLKILFITCLILFLFPIFGRALNGFSYISNRWCWAFALLCCFILVREWDDLTSLSKEQGVYLSLCATALFLVCLFFDKSRSIKTFAAIALLLLSLLALQYFSSKSKRAASIALCALIAAGVCNVSFWKYSSAGDNYASEAIDAQTAEETLLTNEITAIQKLTGDGTVRYSGRSLNKNAGMLGGLSSTSFSWSLSNPIINEFRTDLEMREYSLFSYDGYDDRTALLSLASVNTFVVPSNDRLPVPYGFEMIGSTNVQGKRTAENLARLSEELGITELSEEQTKKIKNASDVSYVVYQNSFALPLGYCYDQYVTDQTWDSLSAPQRQETMLQAVYLSQTPALCSETVYQAPDRSLDYAVKCQNTEISYEDGKAVTTANNVSITLSFDGPANVETYVEMKGLDFDGTSEYELYFGDKEVDPLNLYNEVNWELLSSASRASIRKSRVFWNDPTSVSITMKSSSGISKSFTYTTPENSFTSGRHDYIINLGYSAEPITSVTITFPSRGIYTFDALNVIAMPFDEYEADIERLRASSLKNVSYGVDCVSGAVTVDSPKILCLTIPYSSGWTAYVDDTEAPVYIANGRYIGIELSSGEHAVTLCYSTPYKRVGAIVSLLGIACLGCYWIMGRKRRKMVDGSSIGTYR